MSGARQRAHRSSHAPRGWLPRASRSRTKSTACAATHGASGNPGPSVGLRMRRVGGCRAPAARAQSPPPAHSHMEPLGAPGTKWEAGPRMPPADGCRAPAACAQSPPPAHPHMEALGTRVLIWEPAWLSPCPKLRLLCCVTLSILQSSNFHPMQAAGNGHACWLDSTSQMPSHASSRNSSPGSSSSRRICAHSIAPSQQPLGPEMKASDVNGP